MSKKLKKSISNKPVQPQVWCLSKDDWDKMTASLMVAEEIFKKAEIVTPSEWQTWTSEFGEGQGFPSIIYHDKPIIIRPPESPIHKVG